MKSMLLSLMCVVLIAAGAFGATFVPYDTDGDWSVIGTWGSNESGSWAPATRIPEAADDVIINNNSTVSLDVDATVATVNVNAGSTLNINTAAKTLIVTGNTTVSGLIELSDGAFEPKGTLTINSGGVFRQTGGSSILSALIAQNGGGLYLKAGGLLEISGGTLLMTSRSYEYGTVRIIGDEPTITIHQTNRTDFEFIFDETGVSKIHNDSWSDLSASTFVVDANDYTGEPGDFVLYTGAVTTLEGYEVRNLGAEGVGWTWDHNTTTGTITLTILPPMATNPSPADGETVYGDAPVLSWQGGSTAVAHDVWLDTVNPPAVFEKRVTGTSYDPNTTLAPGIYYWQVDAVEDPNTPVIIHKGDVWSFTIADAGAASNMSPANGATGVATSQLLTWTPGVGAISHDVWFGEAADALELVADDITVAELAPWLLNGKTYYWAVDEFDGTDTYQSPVFSFTLTAPVGGGQIYPQWISSGPSTVWNVDGNWTGGVSPGLGSEPTANHNVPNTLTIEDGQDAYFSGNWLRLGGTPSATADPNAPYLIMNGGSLTGPRLWVSHNHTGFGDGPAIAEMNGGVMNFTTGVTVGTVNDGTLNLNGGVINTPTISIGYGHLNVAGGTLVLDGDDVAAIDGYVSGGKVIGYGGTGKVIASYDADTDKTTVIACADPDIADLTGDCVVDMDDLLLVIGEWLDYRQGHTLWDIDFSNDVITLGEFVDRAPASSAYNYNDEVGLLHFTAPTIFDSVAKYEFIDNANVVFKAKADDESGVALWYDLFTDDGSRFVCWIRVMVDALDPSFQVVEFLKGNVDWGTFATQGSQEAVLVYGFAAGDVLTMTAHYTVDAAANTVTFDCSVTDGTTTQDFSNVVCATTITGVAETQITLWGPGTGYYEDMSYELYISPEYNISGDIDGKIDLEDFSIIASDWLKGYVE